MVKCMARQNDAVLIAIWDIQNTNALASPLLSICFRDDADRTVRETNSFKNHSWQKTDVIDSVMFIVKTHKQGTKKQKMTNAKTFKGSLIVYSEAKFYLSSL